MNLHSKVNDSTFLWVGSLSCALGIAMLLGSPFWWFFRTLSLTVMPVMAGYVVFSLFHFRKAIKLAVQAVCLFASIAVLYNVLGLLPQVNLTNNAPAWLLLGVALSSDDPKYLRGGRSAAVVILLVLSTALFIAFSWLRLANGARSIPGWGAYRNIFQTGRVVFLYLTIILAFAATRIECMSHMACSRPARWIAAAVCLSYAVLSVLNHEQFLCHRYGLVQFILQPAFLFAAAAFIRYIYRRMHGPSAEDAGPARITKSPCSYDIFISYRRAGGSDTADLVKSELMRRGYGRDRIFMDTHSLAGGDFRSNIEQAIRSSANFILIVNRGCFADLSEDSTFLFEIRTALQCGVNIIPFCNGGIDELASLPEDISILSKSNAVVYSHDYPDASYERLKSFLVTARSPFPVRKAIIVVLILLMVAASWIGGSMFPDLLPIQQIEQEYLGR